MRISRTAILGLLLASPSLWAAAVTSTGTGNWSNASTWSSSQVPNSGDTVTILPGHTVTIDGAAFYAANAVTVQGTLQFGTVDSSTLTLVGGDLTVTPGGRFTLGIATAPIVSPHSATLVLAFGSTPGQYGMVIQDGGSFEAAG